MAGVERQVKEQFYAEAGGSDWSAWIRGGVSGSTRRDKDGASSEAAEHPRGNAYGGEAAGTRYTCSWRSHIHNQSPVYLGKPATLTIKNQAAGTPNYMPPESLNHGICTPASDWFAFGLIVFYLATGKHFNKAKTFADSRIFWTNSAKYIARFHDPLVITLNEPAPLTNQNIEKREHQPYMNTMFKLNWPLAQRTTWTESTGPTLQSMTCVGDSRSATRSPYTTNHRQHENLNLIGRRMNTLYGPRNSTNLL
ncbi:unnamed protein product [Allacma fusca]|uniref:Protein kinase domain-containing protein n=1 Tax=Allacma fusca TaxID=39272 RepID=A0A8J2KVJ7_9HEXA|nr:unnamed protein product [Allacma fusca]